MELIQGEKLTVIRYDSAVIGITLKDEAEVISYNPSEKRLTFYRRVDGKKGQVNRAKPKAMQIGGALVFRGWDLHIQTDYETGSFAGNCMMNIMGRREEIHTFIKTYNINPDFERDRVLAVECGCEGVLGRIEIAVYQDKGSPSRRC